MRKQIAVFTVFTALTASNVNAFGQSEETQTLPDPDLFTSGLVTTGAAYPPAVMVAMNSPRPEDKHLYAPLSRPWQNLAQRSPELDTAPRRALLVADGVLQALGALQVFTSFLTATGANAATVETGAFTAHLAPARLPNGSYGLTATGNF